MAKPQYRYKEPMSLSRLLSGESNDHRRFYFFQEYARSREAAAVIGPLLKAWRIAIDFSDPKHCRLQGRKLILTVRDAGQENRLRQLTTRMKKALDQKGIEVDVIDIHLVPVPFALPKLPPAPLVERRETLEGAFSVARCADRVDDPALKATLKRLEEILTPKTGYDEALRAQIERETDRRSKQIENVRRLRSEHSNLEHLTFLCPSAEDAAKNPDFAPIRARMLAKIHILRAREAELDSLLAKLQERFGALLKAQVRLAQGEAPAEVARALYATQAVTETDRLYEAVLADQTPEGR